MEVKVGEDGVRRRIVRAEGSTRTYKLCTGKDNTCTNDAKEGGTCTGCKTGVYRTEHVERADGERFEEDGHRYLFKGGQKRKLCTGKDNSCEKIARSDGKCTGCITGFEKKRPEEMAAGDIIIRNGVRFKYDGTQLRRLCSGNDNTCPKYIKTKDQCSLHSTGGVRQRTVK